MMDEENQEQPRAEHLQPLLSDSSSTFESGNTGLQQRRKVTSLDIGSGPNRFNHGGKNRRNCAAELLQRYFCFLPFLFMLGFFLILGFLVILGDIIVDGRYGYETNESVFMIVYLFLSMVICMVICTTRHVRSSGINFMDSLLRCIWGCFMHPGDKMVVAVDLHKTEAWILASYSSGYVAVWDINRSGKTCRCDAEQGGDVVTKAGTSSLPKLKMKVSDLPVRCVKFVCTKPWIVTVSEDKFVRIFHVETGEAICQWQLTDIEWVSCVETHPNKPLLYIAGDNQIQLWDMEYNFQLINTFQGHEGLVHQIKINPHDTNQFVSASYDGSIKIWDSDKAEVVRTLRGLAGGGVNCVDFLDSHDKQPFLAASYQARHVKVWNYQTATLLWSSERLEDSIRNIYFYQSLQQLLAVPQNGTILTWSYEISDSDGILTITGINAWESDELFDLDQALAVSAQPQSCNKLVLGSNSCCACATVVSSMDGTSAKVFFEDKTKFEL